MNLATHLRPWKAKCTKAKKLAGVRKALRDAYAILKIPEPEALKVGVKLAMNDIKSMLAEYLVLKSARGAPAMSRSGVDTMQCVFLELAV